jgi:hypothetical protein
MNTIKHRKKCATRVREIKQTPTKGVRWWASASLK